MSYHPLAHYGEEVEGNCELCEMVILLETNPAIEPEAMELSNAPLIFKQLVINYRAPYAETTSTFLLFSRPPPVTT